MFDSTVSLGKHIYVILVEGSVMHLFVRLHEWQGQLQGFQLLCFCKVGSENHRLNTIKASTVLH